MAITEKTRKILWGKSGNRCAICRHELVIDPTSLDGQSVVGEECHIVSRKGQGPRYESNLALEKVDEPENLILLCRIHHKMVDDQFETYTVELLRSIKANHEKWISSALSQEQRLHQPRIRRIQENVPSHLIRLNSGSDLMKILSDAFAYAFDNDEPQSDDEAEFIGGVLQELQDWGEIFTDLEAGDRVKATYRMSQLIEEVEQAGFWVFGAREVQRLEGGVEGPSPWPLAIVKLVRSSSPEIIKVDLSELKASIEELGGSINESQGRRRSS